MDWIKKYGGYILGAFLIIAIIWGIYSHLSISALESKNSALLKSNDALISSMKEQQVQWQSKFDNLELRAKQLEATIAQINSQYSVLAKRNTDLQNQISSLKIPVGKEDRIAKYKELGYGGEGISAGVPAPREGVLFDWANSDKLLQTAMENPLLKEQNANLKEANGLLEKKSSTLEQIVKNTEQEVKLALEGKEFAESQNVKKDKIIADQAKVNQDLAKKARRAPLWGIVGFVVGVAAGIAIAVGLGI
jgi:SMC interacting uncharacterized protein involved in chromosome segregation